MSGSQYIGIFLQLRHDLKMYNNIEPNDFTYSLVNRAKESCNKLSSLIGNIELFPIHDLNEDLKNHRNILKEHLFDTDEDLLTILTNIHISISQAVSLIIDQKYSYELTEECKEFLNAE